MRDLAERMLELFRGHEGCHGTYQQEDKRADHVKVEIKRTARTIRSPVTVDLWLEHLQGTRALGVVPINTAGLCRWGAIDVDVYDLSHQELAARVAKIGLPLHVCRSKSGGAHLFVFLREAATAAELIAVLQTVAASLSVGGSEVFPKQTEVLADRGDLGNWLNMPYMDAERGTRYCVDESGRALSLQRFLERAEAGRTTIVDLLVAARGPASRDNSLEGGPPCLQHLAGVGVGEGGRNNALFAFGVLAKKKFPQTWEQQLEDWNRRFISPPLSSEEVMIVVRSLRKKDYNYRCKLAPIVSHCDRLVCQGRQYGVGTGAAPDISSISILDTQPPLFFVTLSSGSTVECRSDDVLTSRAFQRSALEQLHVLLPLFKQDAWQNHLQKCLESAVMVEAPHEVSTAGVFLGLLEQFCTDRHRAQELDEISLGKPWLDEETDRYYFRLADLMNHLESSRFREMTRAQVAARLRDLGGDSAFFNLRGRGLNVWWVAGSALQRQTESHSVPRVPRSPI